MTPLSLFCEGESGVKFAADFPQKNNKNVIAGRVSPVQGSNPSDQTKIS
jgi:hypothetical protein